MENKFMKIAIENAKIAAQKGEIPVGAAIFSDGKLIAEAHNETISGENPCNHAEMLVINRAFEKTGAYRLDNCSLYVTLEPCAMCAGAIILARLKKVYFGAYDREKGALGGKIDIMRELGVKTEVYGGICEEECAQVLKNFFKNKQ